MKVAVIGLGYVGLPLAIEIGKNYECIGFDINSKRICELRESIDITNEVHEQDFKDSNRITFTDNEKDILGSDIFVITVPTPINENNEPDLSFLKESSELVGRSIKPESIVVYESTVYPGLTEEYCGKILEKKSGLRVNDDFSLGYSPERINPGDKEHTIKNIVKVVSASNQEALNVLSDFYGSITTAGVFRAKSIKVAEAAKVIENTQRDVNIALMNELALLFNKLEINTYDVLEAANTKWNFLNFTPGLVGGHCIGVDPYYLTYKAKEVGFEPNLILSGRKINDGMHESLGNILTESLKEKGRNAHDLNALILGYTFKENCPDIRNSKVENLRCFLQQKFKSIVCFDPYVNDNEKGIYSSNACLEGKVFDVIILAVKHDEFSEFVQNYKNINPSTIIFDFKGFYDSEEVDISI